MRTCVRVCDMNAVSVLLLKEDEKPCTNRTLVCLAYTCFLLNISAIAVHVSLRVRMCSILIRGYSPGEIHAAKKKNRTNMQAVLILNATRATAAAAGSGGSGQILTIADIITIPNLIIVQIVSILFSCRTWRWTHVIMLSRSYKPLQINIYLCVVDVVVVFIYLNGI